MHDVAGRVAEDRVKLVLVDREAARAAFLEAVKLLVAEMQHTRPLHDVPADGPRLRICGVPTSPAA